MIPVHCRNEFRIPLVPSNVFQAKIRTRYELQSGKMTRNKQQIRDCGEPAWPARRRAERPGAMSAQGDAGRHDHRAQEDAGIQIDREDRPEVLERQGVIDLRVFDRPERVDQQHPDRNQVEEHHPANRHGQQTRQAQPTGTLPGQTHSSDTPGSPSGCHGPRQNGRPRTIRAGRRPISRRLSLASPRSRPGTHLS